MHRFLFSSTICFIWTKSRLVLSAILSFQPFCLFIYFERNSVIKSRDAQSSTMGATWSSRLFSLIFYSGSVQLAESFGKLSILKFPDTFFSDKAEPRRKNAFPGGATFFVILTGSMCFLCLLSHHCCLDHGVSGAQKKSLLVNTTIMSPNLNILRL